MLLMTVVFAASAMACGPKAPGSLSEAAERIDWAGTPRLPSPDAGAYADGAEAPRDPALNALLRGKHHDGALAGAASALALAAAEGVGGLTRWELREAAWRAGWPYPVADARAWSVGDGLTPPRDLLTWVEQIPADEPMSLVRARGRDSDEWVGMAGWPPVQLGALPRVANLGAPLLLPPVPGGVWRAADASGALSEGSLEKGGSILLSSSGEWLVQVVQGDKEVARFPVYVGVNPATTPLLRLPNPMPQPSSGPDADALARALLDHVRNAYGRPTLSASPMFDAAVQQYMRNPAAGSAAALSAIGFRGAKGIVWACDDVTVENCFDNWVWDLRRREGLMSTTYDSYGLQTSLDGSGVHLTLLLVDAESG